MPPLRAWLIMAGLAAAMPSGVAAQEPTELAGMPVAVDDAELAAFAGAYRQVEEIRQAYAPRMRNGDEPTKESLRREANEQMRKAVAGSRLSSQRYNQLVVAITADSRLRARLAAYLKLSTLPPVQQ